MEVGGPSWVGAGHHEREIGPEEGFEGAPDLEQRPVIGELDDRAMEACIRLGDPMGIVGAGRDLHRLDQGSETLEIDVGQAGNGERSRE
jgi:hypothetical protein